MLVTLHMFSLSVVCTLNTQLKLLPFKRYTVLRRTVNGNFNLTPTVSLMHPHRSVRSVSYQSGSISLTHAYSMVASYSTKNI